MTLLYFPKSHDNLKERKLWSYILKEHDIKKDVEKKTISLPEKCLPVTMKKLPHCKAA